MLLQKDRLRFRADRIRYIPTTRIHPNPTQARRPASEEELAHLSQSIRRHGILQPLSVRDGPDGYELVAGERRWRAAKMAGLKKVPCIVLSASNVQADTLALSENIQRKELDYLEQAEGMARLIRLYDLSQEQLAVMLGRSQSAVANKLRLLHHSQPVQQALRDHGLSERHARALLCLPSEEQKLSVIEQIVRYDLTVSRTEAYIDQLLSRSGEKREPTQAPAAPAPQRDPALETETLLNLIHTQLAQLRAAGIQAEAHQEQTDMETVLTITIPKVGDKPAAEIC